MGENTIVQFVRFDTKLDKDRFVQQWEHYRRSVNTNVDVSLHQQTSKKGNYLAQHRCEAGEFKFLFMKESRSTRFHEVEIKAKQAGGYSTLIREWINDTNADESKIFVFIPEAGINLNAYRQLSAH